jgi:hypothetical protein
MVLAGEDSELDANVKWDEPRKVMVRRSRNVQVATRLRLNRPMRRWSVFMRGRSSF